MKHAYLIAASIITTAMPACPLAYGDPGHGAMVTNVVKTRSYTHSAQGRGSGQPFTEWFFSAQSYDDLTGRPQGSIYVSFSDYFGDFHWQISCTGPAYANVVSVNKTTGETSIKAVLDATNSADCTPDGAPSSVSVAIVGKFDGNYRATDLGAGKSTESGVNYAYATRCDTFGETFSGTIGFPSSFAGTPPRAQSSIVSAYSDSHHVDRRRGSAHQGTSKYWVLASTQIA